MNTALHDSLRPRPSSLREEFAHAWQRAWNEVPAWARSPLAFGWLCACVAIAFLCAIALVVDGVVERSELRHRSEASSARSLWQCAAVPRSARNADCQLQLASAGRPHRSADATQRLSADSSVMLVSLQR